MAEELMMQMHDEIDVGMISLNFCWTDSALMTFIKYCDKNKSAESGMW